MLLFSNSLLSTSVCCSVCSFSKPVSSEHFGRQSGLCWTVAEFCPTLNHSALSVPEFVTRNKATLNPHPPCFSDLVLCDLFLLLKVKMALLGRKVNYIAMI